MNRSKKAMLNLVSQWVMQAVAAVCGFIVPKVMLEAFGSEVNGMVSSISHFLGIISLMESGFGSVAKTAFYKPLAQHDRIGISGVYNATESFFRKVALIFLAYCIILSIAFPLIQESSFDYLFTLLLVLIIGINSFIQYYFGMSYTIALNADQSGYIGAFLQVFTVVLNAIVIVVMVNLGTGIHLVKLVSALVFIIRPIAINLYGRHRYNVDRKVPNDEKSVAQKWDNLGQSIALYVHQKTSYVFITVFLSFKEVSVYSVYSLITTSLTAIITSISTGFVSGLGNMYANKEKETFKQVFSLYEFINTLVTLVFYTIALITMMPFIGVYTAKMTDADYNRPLFGTLLILAEVVYCIRLPYYYMITNAGHFKQIKKGAYIEAGLNIAISISLVHVLGIVGLAIALLVAMVFRTVQIILYCSKNITQTSLISVAKRLVVNVVGAVLSTVVCHFVPLTPTSFLMWFVYAAIVGLTTLAIIGGLNLIFFKDDFKLLLKKFKSVVGR